MWNKQQERNNNNLNNSTNNLLDCAYSFQAFYKSSVTTNQRYVTQTFGLLETTGNFFSNYTLTS